MTKGATKKKKKKKNILREKQATSRTGRPGTLPSSQNRIFNTMSDKDFFFLFFFFFVFLGPNLWHMEIPTATATRDPSRICDLPHSSLQRQIFNPLSKARDRTYIHMDTSRICYH